MTAKDKTLSKLEIVNLLAYVRVQIENWAAANPSHTGEKACEHVRRDLALMSLWTVKEVEDGYRDSSR